MDMSLDSLGPARRSATQGVPWGLLRGDRRRPGARARPSGAALSHGDRRAALGPRRGRAAAAAWVHPALCLIFTLLGSLGPGAQGEGS